MNQLNTYKGKRFDAVINAKASELLKLYAERNDPDEAKNSSDRERRRANLDRVVYYRSEINPDRSYNTGKTDPEKMKEKFLTVETLEDYLNVVEWSNKDFLELCMNENLNYTVKEASMDPRPKGWTYLDWPDAKMKAVAQILDILEDKSVDRVQELIDSMLPKHYWSLMAEMEEESSELGIEKDHLIYVQDEDYIPEKTVDNMGMRIFLTLQYMEPNSDARKAKRSKSDVDYDYPRPYCKRHYWIFPVETINSLCTEFRLSPHWVFFGKKDQLVLAEKQRTEHLMDKYTFLDEASKEFIYHSVEKGYSEGVLR